jgi:phenylalanyl-tRNA synthetase alpha chain
MNNLDSYLQQISSSKTLQELEEARLKLLGKQGEITSLLKTLGQMSQEQRKTEGPLINNLRDKVSEALLSKKSFLENQLHEEKLKREWVDLTLPVNILKGSIHPISKVIEELTDIFARLGFKYEECPEIEDDWHNFTALNIPETHPARAMHDTFYLNNSKLLRTHTSPVQIRTMLSNQLPIKAYTYGKVYRADSDKTHTPMFHQIEAMMVSNHHINIGHLKWTLETFLKEFFERDDFEIRMRPSYFPFTEPSIEVDIGLNNKWLEVLGGGMIHRNVLKNCGITSNYAKGFAFGAGIDRLAMLKYEIDDLRKFFEGDIRWLKHYGFGGIN